LRAVEEGETAFDSTEGQTGPERGAQFTGVARRREVFARQRLFINGGAASAFGFIRRGAAVGRVIDRGAGFSTFATHLLWLNQSSISSPRGELPDRAHDGGVDLFGKVHHAGESGQCLLALVVVVAEADAQLVGDRALLHAADKEIDILLLDELGELERIGVVEEDGARIAELLAAAL
jgi:hypothetical protein